MRVVALVLAAVAALAVVREAVVRILSERMARHLTQGARYRAYEPPVDEWGGW